MGSTEALKLEVLTSRNVVGKVIATHDVGIY